MVFEYEKKPRTKAQKQRKEQKQRKKQKRLEKQQERAKSFVRTHRDEIDASIAAAEQDWRSGRIASADKLFDAFR
jgi:hypothetical protein